MIVYSQNDSYDDRSFETILDFHTLLGNHDNDNLQSESDLSDLNRKKRGR